MKNQKNWHKGTTYHTSCKNRENNEDAPDLFSTTSETLNNDTSDNTEAKSSETDDDYLEIPAFLRRQSKWMRKL